MKSILERVLPDISVDLSKTCMLQRESRLKKLYSEAGIEVALERYRKFLYLISRDPSVKVAPTADIDEIWHCHMLHPMAYYNDCIDYFGFILDHNPSFGANPSEFDSLVSIYKQTERRWMALFDEPYEHFPDFGMNLCRD